jgi:hypothetical protein
MKHPRATWLLGVHLSTVHLAHLLMDVRSDTLVSTTNSHYKRAYPSLSESLIFQGNQTAELEPRRPHQTL